MSDIVTYLVKKDFAEQNLGETIEYSYEIFRSNFYVYVPEDLNINDYYACLVENFPNRYVHEKIKILKIIELKDIFKYDVDHLTIEFFICKYKNNPEMVNKIIGSVNNKHMVEVVQMLSSHNLYDSNYIKLCLKRCPRERRPKMINIICSYFNQQQDVSRYLNYILENYKDLNSVVTLMICSCYRWLKIKDKFRNEIVRHSFEKIKRNQSRLSKGNLKSLIYYCNNFIFSRDLCKIIHRQITKRFNNDVRLLYSFMTYCKYKVDELFEYLCENDKSGYYTLKIVQRFPHIDKRKIEKLIYKNTENKNINKLQDNLKNVRMFCIGE